MIMIRETPVTRRHTLGVVAAVRPVVGIRPVTGDRQG
jgi:hypothetical protein